MSMSWSNTMSAQLEAIAAKAFDLSQDAAEGAKVILEDAEVRVPKRSGDLAGTGRVKEDRGGRNTAAVTYDGPYARWVHEHLLFKHPFGGEAKFLETAMLTKGEAAINQAGQHFWERL